MASEQRARPIGGKRRVLEASGAGSSIEVTSFVSPRKVPQLADAEEVFHAIRKKEGVTYTTLVPNEKGLRRALSAGVRSIAVFTAASETFNRRNISSSIDESMEDIRQVTEEAFREGLRVRAYISMAFVCPYEGRDRAESSRVPDASGSRDPGHLARRHAGGRISGPGEPPPRDARGPLRARGLRAPSPRHLPAGARERARRSPPWRGGVRCERRRTGRVPLRPWSEGQRGDGGPRGLPRGDGNRDGDRCGEGKDRGGGGVAFLWCHLGVPSALKKKVGDPGRPPASCIPLWAGASTQHSLSWEDA